MAPYVTGFPAGTGCNTLSHMFMQASLHKLFQVHRYWDCGVAGLASTPIIVHRVGPAIISSGWFLKMLKIFDLLCFSRYCCKIALLTTFGEQATFIS